MPPVAIPLIVQDSAVILAPVATIFGAGFLAGLRWNGRKHEKMRLHGLA